MNTRWLSLLTCPQCRGSLEILDPPSPIPAEITDGLLHCGACSARFPLSQDILSCLPASETPDEEEAWKRAEQEIRDREAAHYDSGYSDGYRDFERLAIMEALRPQRSARVVELGIGTGRIAEAYAEQVRGVVGVDFSRASLLLAREKLRRLGVDYCLIQADVCRLPLREGSFDGVVCAQVFQHLPGESARAQGFSEAGRVLRAGGRFILTVYYHSPEKRWRHRRAPSERSAKEGSHTGGGIYYHNYGYRELRSLLETAFIVERVSGVRQMRPYWEERGRFGCAMERISQRTPLGLLSAHLLLGVGRKR